MAPGAADRQQYMVRAWTDGALTRAPRRKDDIRDLEDTLGTRLPSSHHDSRIFLVGEGGSTTHDYAPCFAYKLGTCRDCEGARYVIGARIDKYDPSSRVLSYASENGSISGLKMVLPHSK